MRSLLLLIIAIFSLAANSTGDLSRYRDDYRLIMGAYKSHPSLAFDVSYNDHENELNAKADTTLQARYYFKGNKFYYRFGGMEVLKNDEYYITVNPMIRTITVSKAADINMDFLPISGIDSVIKYSSYKVNYSEKDGGKKGCYRLEAPETTKAFDKMEMDFDLKSHLVDKVKMYVSAKSVADLYDYGPDMPKVTNNPWIEYVFSNYRFNNLDDNMFSSARFITKGGTDFTASKQYDKYKVIHLVTVNSQSR